MKLHRFDPFSFVAGLATVALAAMLLWGDLDMADMRPSRLWPLPVLLIGSMFTLYGVRRLVEAAGARDAGNAEASPSDPVDPYDPSDPSDPYGPIDPHDSTTDLLTD